MFYYRYLLHPVVIVAEFYRDNHNLIFTEDYNYVMSELTLCNMIERKFKPIDVRTDPESDNNNDKKNFKKVLLANVDFVLIGYY